MKLNLGCGEKKWEGFINCDLENSDHDCDIRKLPFQDNSADEIHAIHVFEHFYLMECFSILKEWKRVLKPGGLLVLELPCWDKIKQGVLSGIQDEAIKCAIFGDPHTHKSEFDLHKWCWSSESLVSLCKKAGFKKAEIKTAQFHVPERDMRIEAIK